MLTILDYDAGNLTSVLRALNHLGIPAKISAEASVLEASEGVIFPGVGAAGSAMEVLRARGLDKTLHRIVERQQPLLGICLGCQILLDASEEKDTKTLGIISGTTRLFPDKLVLEDGSPAPVPHMGWNTVRLVREDPLFDGIDKDAQFYFVHSYYTEPAPELVLGVTHYGMDFCSAYGRLGLWATQFHPEKSGRWGLKILSNFYEYCRQVNK